MIVYAAIDLRGGRCVQLVGGRPAETRVSRPDPIAAARHWRACGFRALHVVDLDAALGTGGDGDYGSSNHHALIRGILEAAGVPVQVGGGVRDNEAIRNLLDAGADRIVVGTRAVEDPGWLEAVSARYPGRLVVAVDVRGGEVVTRGWTERTGLDAVALLNRLDGSPLAGVLVTDVAREGGMEGPDLERFAGLVAETEHGLVAAGGIRNGEDLRALAATGAAGAVLGMALYTGAADARAIARAFDS